MFAFGALLWHSAAAALLMEEGFPGPPASSLAATPPWAGGSDAAIQIVSGNLSMAGVPPTAPAGNLLQVGSGTQTINDYRTFTGSPVSSGTVYFSALLNCASLSSSQQFVLALLQSGTTQPNQPDDPLDLYVVGQTNGSGYRLAISHTGSDQATAGTILTTHTTHLIVMKYDFTAGRSSLYIDPPPGAPEPARADAATDSEDGGDQNPANLQVLLFQSQPSSGLGTLLFDTMRIGEQWWDVVQVHVTAIGPANLTNCLGGSATFSVTAAGTAPFSYQWRTNGTPVDGATNNVYTLVSTGPADAFNFYDVVVNDQLGSVTSRLATLSLASVPPAISVQPTNPVIQGPVSNATFSVTATGDAPLSYQWRVNGLNLNGATRRTYTLSNPRPSTATNAYDVVVSNLCGLVISSPPAHPVFPPPGVAVRGPQDQVVCAGSAATFTVATIAGTPPFSYQWRVNGTALASATLNSYTLASAGPGNMPATYDVVVNDSFGSTTSRVANLTVSTTAPGIAVSPTDLILKPTLTNATFAVAATGDAPLSFQWRTNGIPILGATNSTFTVTNPGASDTLKAFDVVVANPCGSITSAPRVQILFPHPFFGCGASPGFFGGMNLATTNSPGMTLYAWSSPDLNAPVTGWTLEGQLAEQPLNDGSGNSYYEINVNPLTSPVYCIIGTTNVGPYVTPAPVELIATDSSGSYSFSVTNLPIDANGWLGFLSLPTLTSQPLAQTVMAGKTASFSVTATGAAFFSYQWYFNSNLPLPAGTNATLTLAGVTPGQAGTYSILVATSSGSVTSTMATLTVLPPAALSLERSFNGYQLSAVGMPGDILWVETTTNLAPPVSWVKMATNVADVTGLVQFTDTDTNLTSKRFYRLGSPPTIPGLPVIIRDPTSRTVLAGKAATFNVVAAGAIPLMYQWYSNTSVPLAGATNATLQVTSATPGSYSVVVTNAYGSATSGLAALTFLPPPVLRAQVLNYGLELSASGVPGDVYWVQVSTALTPPATWVTMATNVVGTDGLVRFTDANATIPSTRFYRLLFP